MIEQVETAPEFVAFPKIARLNREWIVTEKLDGTNACVLVSVNGTVRAGSRTRWITPKDDNFGFARWVEEHQDELRVGLGIGLHHGEWFGSGIQRGYGLKEKRFALFNVALWSDDSVRPKCCHVVPVLTRGIGVDHLVTVAIRELSECGSTMVPGWTKPEGVVAFHTASHSTFKVTVEHDESRKGQPQ